MGLSYNHGSDQNLGFCPFLILILLPWWRYKSFTLSRSYTKWENHLLLSYWEDGFQKFPATNLINAARMTKPIIFKPKNICLWDACANLDFAGKVVRGNPCKREDSSKGILITLSNWCEEPINLLKKWGVLHITPSITLTLDR